MLEMVLAETCLHEMICLLSYDCLITERESDGNYHSSVCHERLQSAARDVPAGNKRCGRT